MLRLSLAFATAGLTAATNATTNATTTAAATNATTTTAAATNAITTAAATTTASGTTTGKTATVMSSATMSALTVTLYADHPVYCNAVWSAALQQSLGRNCTSTCAATNPGRRLSSRHTILYVNSKFELGGQISEADFTSQANAIDPVALADSLLTLATTHKGQLPDSVNFSAYSFNSTVTVAAPVFTSSASVVSSTAAVIDSVVSSTAAVMMSLLLTFA